MPVVRRRLLLAAALTGLVIALLAPLTCSQGSGDARPRCEAALGYPTPVSEAGAQLLLVLLLGLLLALLGTAAVRRR